MTYLILALATWRITSLLVNEAGPRDFFLKLRIRLGVTYSEYGDHRHGDSFLAQLLICPWCLSIWAAIVITLFYYALPDVTFWISLPLAISTFAILWEEIIEKLE